MNFSILKTIVLLMGVFLSSCNNNTQQLLNPLNKATATREAADASPAEIQTEGLDSETAYEPVMIGGAFLACAFEEQVSVMRCSYAEKDGPLKDIQLGSIFHVNQYVSNQKGDLMGTVKVASVQNFFELPISDAKSLPLAVLVEMMLDGKLIRTDVATLTVIPATPVGANPLMVPCADGFSTNGYCFYYGDAGDSCTERCADRGGVNVAGTRWANNTRTACDTVFNGLGAATYGRPIREITLALAMTLGAGGLTGCTVETDNDDGGGDAAGRWIVTAVSPSYPYADGSEGSARRACACNN